MAGGGALRSRLGQALQVASLSREQRIHDVTMRLRRGGGLAAARATPPGGCLRTAEGLRQRASPTSN